MALLTLDQLPGVKVDSCDVALVSRYKWRIRHNVKVNVVNRYVETVFITASGVVKHAYMHRLILGLTDRTVLVDHKNGDGLDNRRCNLRLANFSESNRHRRVFKTMPSSPHKSKFRGVAFYPKISKWVARIEINGKAKHLGVFVDEIAAARAYDIAAKLYHGDFAVINEV